VVALSIAAVPAYAEYPLTLTLDAKAATPAVSVAATMTIRVEGLMLESRRTRVTDALAYGGYGNFVTALRALPSVGTIVLGTRSVDIRYAHEQEDGAGRRLVLVADRPLYFLGDPAKPRAGYELTLVELRFDPAGAVTATMAGAARVKPGPDRQVVIDDFAEAPLQLTVRPGPDPGRAR
jgi:hypothetical protein